MGFLRPLIRTHAILSRASRPAVSIPAHRLGTMRESVTQPTRVQLHSQSVQYSGKGSSLFAGHSASHGITCKSYSSSSGSNSNSSTPKAVPILLRLGRALLRAAIAVVAAALLTAAALPAVLSTQAGLQNAVRLVNCFTPAQVTVSQVQFPGPHPDSCELRADWLRIVCSLDSMHRPGNMHWSGFILWLHSGSMSTDS